MTRKFMHAGEGLNVNDVMWVFAGSGVPGGTTETDDAPKGSIYSNLDTGVIYRKNTAGAGTDKWQETADTEPPKALNSVTTPVIIDQVLVDEVSIQKWIVDAVDAADPTKRESLEVLAINNGTSGPDATVVDFNEYGKLKMGGGITGFDVDVTLTGAGVGQAMQLNVESTSPADVVVRRVNTGQTAGEATPLDLATVPHDIAVTYFGLTLASAILLFYAPTRSIQIPANFPNSQAVAGVAAAAETVFTIHKRVGGVDTQFGTITFSAGSDVGVYSTSVDTTISAGEQLKIVGPASPDGSLSDIALSLQAVYL